MVTIFDRVARSLSGARHADTAGHSRINPNRPEDCHHLGPDQDVWRGCDPRLGL